MIVIYLKTSADVLDCEFTSAIMGFPAVEERGSKLYMHSGGSEIVLINNLTKAGYELYPDQQIEPRYEFDTEAGEMVEVPQTLRELNLRELESGDLPHSGHYARLDAVYPQDILKGEVSRYFNGQWWGGIRCLATQWVFDCYQQGKIEIGDYMWVYFSNDPRPEHEGETIPIIIDKVVFP